MLLKTQLEYFQKHNKNSKIQIERDWYQKNIYIYIYIYIYLFIYWEVSGVLYIIYTQFFFKVTIRIRLYYDSYFV